MSEDVEKAVEAIDELILEGEVEEAGVQLTAALEAYGRQAELLVLQAELSLEAGEFEETLTSVEQGSGEVEDAELRGRLLAAKGYAHYYRDELSEARGAFNDAVRACPELISTLVGRAMVHESLGYFAAAMLDLDRSIELDDEESQPWSMRGAIHLRFGNLEEAKKNLEKAVELDVSEEEALLNLARIHALSGETPEAMERLEVLVSEGEDPDFVGPGLLLRSQLSLALGSFEPGYEDASRAMEVIEDLPWAYLQGAACLLMGGAEPGKAIDLLKQAEDRVDSIQDIPDLYALRATAYDQLGKPEKAQEWKDKAEGVARLPGYVYGGLNPAGNVPLNPAKPIDIRALLDDLFGEARLAPEGYEQVLRQIVDKIPEIVAQNPKVGQLQVELPEAPGMLEGKRQLVIQINQPRGGQGAGASSPARA